VQAYKGKHECEKPLPLMEHIIKASTRPGAIVLDPFMGSGSTGHACLLHGRQFIGIEMQERWCQYADERLRKVQNMPPVEVPEHSTNQLELWPI
jgi:DNA modification methylase